MGKDDPKNLSFAGSVVLEPDGKVTQIDQEQDGPQVPAGSGEIEWITPECSGRYEVREEYGRGGQARVMLAFDRHVGREIALKELLRSKAPEGASKSAEASMARFLREARITGQLEHPNIVPVYEVGVRPDGQRYYAMRLVRGRTLAQALSECRNLSERIRLLPHFVDMCHAIAFAHNRQVIHRDIKPENVMVGEFGETVLLDWGLAKVRGQKDERSADIEEQARLLHQAQDGKTISGSALGTPSYMSPEQAEGEIEEIDERSDIWGLGAVLYQILTGQPPHGGETPYEIVGKVMREDVKPVADLCPAAPPELSAVAEKSLRRDKLQRYQDASGLAADVSAYMTGEKVRAYEYTSWELFKRFAAKNKTVFLAAVLIFGVVIAALITVSVSYRREYQQRLTASYHLAQAYASQADQMLTQKKFLSGRIYAAASLTANPAHPQSKHFEKGFADREPGASHLRVNAASLVYRSRYRPVRGLVKLLSPGSAVYGIRYDPAGRNLAVGTWKGDLVVYDALALEESFRVKTHQRSISDLAFSPDGALVATGGRDGTMRVWRVGRSDPLLEITELGGEVWSVDYSHDGKRMAIGMENGHIQIREAATGKLERAIVHHRDQLKGLTFSPDDRLLASGSWDKTIGIWEVSSGRRLAILGDHTDSVYRLAYSPDGRYLLSAGADRSVRIWDTKDYKLVKTLMGHRDIVYQADWSKDGSLIASGELNGDVYIWDVATGKKRMSFRAHSEQVYCLDISPDGRWLATSGSDAKVRLWDLSGSGENRLLRLVHKDWTYSVQFSPDDRLIASGTWDGLVTIWDSRDGRRLKTLAGHTRGVFSVEFSPDGKLLASASQDRTARIWEVATGALVRELKGHQAEILNLGFSPDGKHIVTASRDKSIRIWEVASGRQLTVLTGRPSGVWSVEYSPDGKKLGVSYADGKVMILDPTSKEPPVDMTGHSGQASDVEFYPDGQKLISSGQDGKVLIWDTSNGKLLKSFQGHKTWVNQVDMSAPQNLIASACDDGTSLIWNANSGEMLMRFQADGMVGDVVFSRDGRRLAVVDRETVVIYPLDFSVLQADPARLRSEAEQMAGLRLTGFELSVAP